MSHQDYDAALEAELRSNRPLRDACTFCGASRFDSLHSNYKGCRFCRQNHSEAISIGMGNLSDKYCKPLGKAKT